MRSSTVPSGDQLVDLDGAALADPVGPVGGLVLDRRVPPPVEMDDVGRGGEVEPGPTRLQRDEEQRRPLGILEPPDHLVARRAPHTAVQPQGLDAEPALEVGRQQLAPGARTG